MVFIEEKAFLISGSLIILSFVPETKGKSCEEIQNLFVKNRPVKDELSSTDSDENISIAFKT